MGLDQFTSLGMDSTVDNQVEDPDGEGETCSVSGSGCMAPAGHMGANGALRGFDYLMDDEVCDMCGEPVCEACLNDGMCDRCEDPDEDIEW